MANQKWRCQKPRPTKRTASPPRGSVAWCPGCKSWQPSEQVPWGQELRNPRGEITATFAPIPH